MTLNTNTPPHCYVSPSVEMMQLLSENGFAQSKSYDEVSNDSYTIDGNSFTW